MAWLVPALIAVITSSVILFFVYAYLYKQEHDNFLATWTVSWGFYASRYVFTMLLFFFAQHQALLAVNQLCALWAGYFLLVGTNQFSKRTTSNWWLVGSAANSLWILAATFGGVPFLWLTLPTFTFMAVVNCWVGIIFLRLKASPGLGAKIVGYSFIIWGLHKADYPFLKPVAWFAPWGYMLGAILALVVAIGIILVYFQKTKNELSLSEHRYRQTFESNQAIKVVLDPEDGAIVDANQAACDFYGYPREVMTTKTVFDLNVLSEQEVKDKMAEVMGERSAKFSFTHRLASGATREVEVYSGPISYQDRTLINSIIFDVTERKEAEAELRASEERMALTVSGGDLGTWDWDIKTGHVAFNQRWAEMLGYDLSEIEPHVRSWEMLMHPGDAAPVTRVLEEHLSGRTHSYSTEHRLRHKDGSWIWVLDKGRVIERDAEGNPLRACGTHLDISERRQAEELLRSNAEYTRLQNSVLKVFATADDDQFYSAIMELVRETLRSGYGIFGYFRKDGSFVAPLVDQNAFWEKRDAGGREIVFEAQEIPVIWRKALDSRQTVIANQGPFNTPLGHIEIKNTVVTPIYYRDELLSLLHLANKPGGYDEADCDLLNRITEYIAPILHGRLRRQEEEEERKQSEEKFRLAFNTSPDAININRLEDGRYIEVNQGFTDLTGFTPEDVVGKTSIEIEIWADPADRQALVRDLREKGYCENLEANFRRKDGSINTALMSARVINLQGVAHIISITRDISERIRSEQERARLESQLRQSQKMEAIGTLAGGIAHDFNNILGAIVGYAELAHDDALEGNVDPEDIDQIIHAAGRAKELVRQILTFSRRVEPERRTLDLNKEVSRSMELLRHTLPKMISTEFLLTPELRQVNADPTQISQVIFNLASNALHAMPDGGRLTISTNNLDLDSKCCPTCGESFSGDWVTLAVSDSGKGIDPDDISRIFDPFFTTKDVGEGTGLGLSMTHGIVLSHGGHVDCESHIGQGTTFTIYLPASQGSDEIDDYEGDAELAELVGGNETILLVDDELNLRELGARTMKSKGYQVITADSGEKALEIYRQRGHEVDLAVMDLGMPGMGGHKAMSAILAMDPSAKIIVASGYSASGRARDALQDGAAAYVGKPFKQAELLFTIRRVLDRS